MQYQFYFAKVESAKTACLKLLKLVRVAQVFA